MIHSSALWGTPLLTRLGTLLVAFRTDNDPALVLQRPEHVAHSSTGHLQSVTPRYLTALASNILDDAGSLISDESHQRGVIGGSTLDGQVICVWADDPSSTLSGIMAVWAANGVAMPITPNHRAEPSAWQCHAILASESHVQEAEEMVKDWDTAGWVTALSDAGTHETATLDAEKVDERWAEWLRDLDVNQDILERPAIVLLGSVSARQWTLAQSSG